MYSTRLIIRLLARVATVCLLAWQPLAHAFPDRPIKLVVPYPAGGTADTLARALAENLRAELGQPVLIENKSGANTIIGAQAVINSSADGYTLLMSTAATLVLNPLMYSKLAYNPARDLTPVSLIASSGLVMMVNPLLKVGSVGEFTSLSKQKGGRMNYASIGLGSSMHLATELYKLESGADMVHVPYSGSAPALTALLANDVDVFFDAVGSSLPHINSGRLIPLAVTTPRRLPILPNVPTMAEAGVPGYEASVWFGLSAPAGTPATAVGRINEAMGKALKNLKFRAQFEALGFVIAEPNSPADYAAHVARERARWERVIRAKKITLD